MSGFNSVGLFISVSDGLNISLPLDGMERPPWPETCGTSKPSSVKPCFVATISVVGEYGGDSKSSLRG